MSAALARCPGCLALMDPSSTSCPICLRLRDRREIMRGYAQPRNETARRRKRLLLILVALAAVAGVSKFLYGRKLEVKAALLSASVKARALGAKSFVQQPEPQRRQTEAPPPPSKSVPSAAPPAEIVIDELPLPPAAGGRWTLYGRVYDLKTLQPAVGVRVTIERKNTSISTGLAEFTGLPTETTTDQHGRYLLTLADADEDYETTTPDPRYAPRALHESDIPYPALSASERSSLINAARTNDLFSTPLARFPGETSVRRDLFLAPK